MSPRVNPRDEWLAGLKPGDKVAVPGRWSDAGQILLIERLTATQIIVAGGIRFRRDSGRAVSGNDWSRPFLQPVTQEVKDAIERQRLCGWLHDIASKRQSMPMETLRAIKAAYDAATKLPEHA